MLGSLRGAACTALVCLIAGVVAGCGGGGDTSSANLPEQQTMSAQAQLGEKIFSDPTLSASGRQSCATCHVEINAHAPDNSLPAQMGGVLLELQGNRNTPSINYLTFNTPFFFDGEGTPTGGFFWDGRVNSLQEQAGKPFVQANEMANASKADVISKLSRAAYAEQFKAVFGSDIFDRPDDAFDRLTLALQAYQREDVTFREFTSKYDEFLRGNVKLTDQEMRGLALYQNPQKGNCIGCHPSTKAADGSFPLFTDFTYDNLGVPRNPELTQNADPAFYDLGLCSRADLPGRTDLCGAFKVPSLRNVGLRHSFFHNGRFHTLKDALTFYVQRDTNPEKFYPLNGDGTVKKFDDLPIEYHGNVNTTEVPYNRKPGDAPALTDAEIDDVIAFLQTLTDGYRR